MPTTDYPASLLQEGTTRFGGTLRADIEAGVTGWQNVKDYGAKGNGTADDTAALQAAYNAAAAAGGVVYLPPGSYGVTGTINCHGSNAATALPVVTVGAGSELVSRIKALNDIAGPVLNCAPTTAAPSPSWQFRDVYIDQQLAPSSTGLYVNNVQLLTVERCKFRSGTIGLDIGAVSAGWFERLVAYNQTTAGYRYASGTTTDSQGHEWHGCDFFMSTGATVDCNAGWLDLSGHQDQTYVSCRVMRAPNIANKLPYGWKLDGVAGSGGSFFVNCIADAVVDGGNPGTGAAYYFKSQANTRMIQCWASALDVARSWRQPGVVVDGCSRADIADSYLSGTGLTILGTSDIVHVRGNHFPNPSTADACITLAAATLTNLYVADNTKEKTAAAAYDSVTAALAALIPGSGIVGSPRLVSGALSTQAFVSATAAQVSTTRDVTLLIPFTGDATNNAATLKLELSPDNVTYSTLDTLSIAAALNLSGALNVPVTLPVPAGWYVKLTATHGTIGTTTWY